MLANKWPRANELRDVAARLNPHGNRPTTTRARAHSGSEGPREEEKR